MTNQMIRTAMLRAGLKQYDLADILGCSVTEVSIMLRRELSRSEQRRIVMEIRGHEEANHETNQNDTRVL